jgi:hypothetical protein
VKAGHGSAKDGKVTTFIPTPNAEIATPDVTRLDRRLSQFLSHPAQKSSFSARGTALSFMT